MQRSTWRVASLGFMTAILRLGDATTKLVIELFSRGVRRFSETGEPMEREVASLRLMNAIIQADEIEA
jgi:hypothetical protein